MRHLLIILLLFSASTAVAEERPADDLGQKFLDAMGGAEVWKEAKFIRNWAVNWNPERRPGPYSHEYWFGLTEKKQHIELKSQWVDLRIAYDEKQGWRQEGDVLTIFDEEALAGWHHDWNTSLYRKIYLLAIGDPSLKLTTEDGKKVHFTYAGDYAGWIEIADDGAPVRLGGSRDNDRHVVFQPLVSFGPVSWPRGGADQSGWRFEILKVELADDAPVSFQPPE